MNAHSIVVTRAVADPTRLVRFLTGHGGDVVPWEVDGRTVGPEIPCDAFDTRSESTCLGVGIVEVDAIEVAGGGYEGELLAARPILCGRHFNLHRKGIGLLLT